LTFEIDRDPIREKLLGYTRAAFEMLPSLDNPHILDVGCGSGIPTLELLRLSNGRITALDIDQRMLDRLRDKAEAQGLSDRITILKVSIPDMDFPDESFDVIWAEGSIAVIGFREGIQRWRRLLKPGGFLAVHDEDADLQQKLDHIPACGYDLIGYFVLSPQIWWERHYQPLQNLIDGLKSREGDNPEIMAPISEVEEEIAALKSHPERFSSAFFVMKKNAS